MPEPDGRAPTRTGRASATSASELGRIGLELILERGFDAVTVDDIAARAGIGRRTFFRYFASKNDLPWGDFDLMLQQLRDHLAAAPDDLPLVDALRDAVVGFNTYPAAELAFHRRRMAVLLETPTLVAHSSLRYASWRQIVADFTAERLGTTPSSLVAQIVGRTCLAIALAAYERWLADDDAVLPDLIAEGFDELADAFSARALAGSAAAGGGMP
ncbi:mycofactocin system transcriptional regulator [Microbacterium marinilacus]|uniref:Mycofactocin system transcriptional regulator n=1 Tax=Microbacterium marinilacus TaxID=415209 RepID=A0ABP7BMB5_9MICO|nr:mycofactocin system transcriptional regulator [Microbacterium marinilacus]MBY0688365.1 mycofactocin system transcriptional regulator [Microbacterium marinilacus]